LGGFIDHWLASDRGSRLFLIIGEPGSGKTAIAARLFGYSKGSFDPPAAAKCIRPDFLSAAHFCSARDAGWIDPLRFVQSISHQLAQRYLAFRAALLEVVGQSVITATATFDVGTKRRPAHRLVHQQSHHKRHAEAFKRLRSDPSVAARSDVCAGSLRQ
jgi:hypothetical protein